MTAVALDQRVLATLTNHSHTFHRVDGDAAAVDAILRVLELGADR